MLPAPPLDAKPTYFGTRPKSWLFRVGLLGLLVCNWLLTDVPVAEAGKRSGQRGHIRPTPTRKQNGTNRRITRPLEIRKTKQPGALKGNMGWHKNDKSQLSRLHEGFRRADAEARAMANLTRHNLPTPLRAALERILRTNQPQSFRGKRRKKRGRSNFKSAAAFDADGTLWAGDVGEGFFQYLLDRPEGFYSPRIRHFWKRYQAGDFKGGFTSEAFYEMMVTGLAGHKIKDIKSLADEYFRLHAQRIFRPMVALIHALNDAGVDVHVVSGSPLWVVEAGARYFNIPSKKVIGLEPDVDANGVILPQVKHVRIGRRTIKVNPWKENKPRLLQPRLQGRELVLVAGDSKGDLAMLKLAKRHARVLVNPKGEALTFARKTKSIIINYEPEHEALGGMGAPPNWAMMPGMEPLPPKTSF